MMCGGLGFDSPMGPAPNRFGHGHHGFGPGHHGFGPGHHRFGPGHHGFGHPARGCGSGPLAFGPGGPEFRGFGHRGFGHDRHGHGGGCRRHRGHGHHDFFDRHDRHDRHDEGRFGFDRHNPREGCARRHWRRDCQRGRFEVNDFDFGDCCEDDNEIERAELISIIQALAFRTPSPASTPQPNGPRAEAESAAATGAQNNQK